MQTLGRVLGFVGKKYWLHLIVVVIAIVVSVLSMVQGTLFTKTLIDSYILPLVKTVQAGGTADFSGLIHAITRVALFYACGVLASLLQARVMIYVTQGALRDLLERISAREDVTSARIVENMYVYAACSDAAAAERCAAAWAQDAPFQMEVSGRKVYWFPPGIDKGTALRRAAGRYRPERILCAGDSVIDVPMLRRADLAMIPDGTLLPALPAERTLVCQENVRFPDFVLRTVLAQAGPG